MADTSLVAVGATTCGLSLVFGWVAIKTHRDHRRWCAQAVKADGVVSRLAERRSSGGLSEDAAGVSTGTNVGMVPVARFRADDGIEYEIDAPEAPAEIGFVILVAYEPGRPSGARVVSRTPKIGCAVVLFVVGVMLVAIGLGR